MKPRLYLETTIPSYLVARRSGLARVSADPPLLFDVQVDSGETVNVAARHPEVLTEIAAAVERHRATIQPAPTQLDATTEPVAR